MSAQSRSSFMQVDIMLTSSSIKQAEAQASQAMTQALQAWMQDA